MNRNYFEKMLMGIEQDMKNHNLRVNAAFPVSERQADLTERILAIQKQLDAVPDKVKLMVYGAGEEVKYLFQLTNLHQKNLICFLDDETVTTVYDIQHNNRAYPVYVPNAEIIQKAEYILAVNWTNWTKIQDKYRNGEYKGEIGCIYSEKPEIPFYCVYEGKTEEHTNDIYHKMDLRRRRCANEYELGLIKRIDKINQKLAICGQKRIIVYAAGAHTYFMMKYTNLKYCNVVGIADRSVDKILDIKVRSNKREDFEDADYIVISSYQFQSDIARYLEGIGLKDKILTLYDKGDPCEFYKNPNIYGADLPYYKEYESKIEPPEVKQRIEELCSDLSCNSDYYVTYQIWEDPLKHPYNDYDNEDIIAELKNYRQANEQVGIILQGPVIYKDDFTYNTICLYKRIFPGATIILSTWKTEAEKKEFEKFQSLEIEVVLSDPPIEPGLKNINYQIKSSYAGAFRAKERNLRYCIKTRTDFRLYAKGCFRLAINLWENYPLKEKNSSQAERLIILPLHLDIEYFIPDYMMLGNTDDMLNFWNTGELIYFKKVMNPEMLLFSRYFHHIGKYVKDPIEELREFTKVLADHFIVMDVSMFQPIWKKYTYESLDHWKRENRFTFTDWFSMQTVSRV